MYTRYRFKNIRGYMEELNIKELAKNYYKNRISLSVEDIEKLLVEVYEYKEDQKGGFYGKHSPQPHYDNLNGSLYKFSEDHKLNAWEFDIIKRIVRCRKKGQFEDDLRKTKDVIDLYLKEYDNARS